MFYRIITGIFVGLVCLSVNAQQKEQRVALVIGNSSYKSSPLKNPVNDARDMANSLRGYGFTVIERTNLTTRQVGQTLREFRSKLTPGSVAVVFYAGHGIQIKGENYLPTVDAEINGEEDVPMQSLSTRQVMDVLGEAKTRMNLVFLDACRDNPYARSFRSGSRGIAKENAPSGTLISFATRPGSVAGDGNGRNGLYTSVLLEQIKQSNQPIEQVLKRVVSGVKVASKGQQEPWMEGSIEGNFCFGSCQQDVGIKVDADEEAWAAAKSMNNTVAYEAYLREFPSGRFASAAKIAREGLSQNNSRPTTDQAASSQAVSSYLPIGNSPSGISTGHYSRQFSILAPDKAENGAVVPVGFKFNPPLQEGESVELVLDGNSFGRVRVDVGTLELFSTRIRMSKSGSISAQCPGCQAVNKQVSVILGASVSDQPGSLDGIRLRLTGNTFRALLSSDSNNGGKYQVQGDGLKVTVDVNGLLSKNPFFQFDGMRFGANACLTATVSGSTKKECATQ